MITMSQLEEVTRGGESDHWLPIKSILQHHLTGQEYRDFMASPWSDHRHDHLIERPRIQNALVAYLVAR